MNTRTYACTAAFFFFFCIPSIVLADIIFFKNGNRLKVEKAWQEEDQVCFIYSDMQASIPRSKVARIESDKDQPPQSEGSGRHANTANTYPRFQPPDAGQSEKPQVRAKTASAARQTTDSVKIVPSLRPDGFGDLKWGARADNAAGFEIKSLDSDLKDVVVYKRPNDGLKLGDAELISIEYAFWRDKLYAVTVWTRGASNFEALRRTVFDHFGQGTRPKSDPDRYLWSNLKTDVMLKYTKADAYGFLWMRSKVMDRKFKLSQLNGPASYLKWLNSRK